MLFGAHVSSSGGISRAIDRADAMGCSAVQVFTQSPRMWRATMHSEEEIARFRARRVETRIGSVVCHALYLVNLATGDRELHRRSVTALEATIDAAVAIGAEAVILHVGSHLGAGLVAAHRVAVPALRHLLDHADGRTSILLENAAGQGNTIGRTTEELAALIDALDRHPGVGVCIDSCHLWVSGVDVTDADVLDAAVAEIDARFGVDRVRCLHVNDSAAPLGSNRDRHASIRSGLMGAGLATFLAHPAFQGLPAILETPGPEGNGPDAREVKALRSLHRTGLRAREG